MILQWQCSQDGAIAWIAHSKLSNVCRAPAAMTSKVLSYSLPQTSHFAIEILLNRARYDADSKCRVCPVVLNVHADLSVVCCIVRGDGNTCNQSYDSQIWRRRLNTR